MNRVSTEFRVRVYDDDHGFYVEARPDSDGLGLCEFAYSDGDADAKEIRFCVSWAMASTFADAILKVSAIQPDASA